MANYKVLATWDISIQNLYKDITLIQQGISCKLNISLRSISRVTVNYKVGSEYVTDLCRIDLDNNKVIVPFKKNVLEVGKHSLELVCHMKNGDVLPTPNYSYTVTKSLTNDNDITEEDAYPVLIGMIQELTKNEAVIQANEEARANAEMYRELNEDERQNAEAERKANENTRISNENTRQSNESNRQQYETQRRVEEDERLTDEQVRVNAENIRIANENERLRKEIERQNAEELRQIAYNSSLYGRMDEIENKLTHEVSISQFYVDDFTEALTNALKTPNVSKINLDGNYNIKTSCKIENINDVIFTGKCNLTLKNDMDILYEFYKCKNISIDGISIDCCNLNLNQFIYMNECENSSISNISVQNIFNKDETNEIRVLNIYSNSFKIYNINFNNIKARFNKDNVTSGKGSISNIFILIDSDNKNGYISNIYSEECHNIDINNDIIMGDVDTIKTQYVNGINSSFINSNININNVSGKNFGKRLIKLQTGGVNINNVYGYTNEKDTFSIIGVHNKDVNIENVNLYSYNYASSRFFEVSLLGSNINLSNFKVTGSYSEDLFGLNNSSDEYKKVIIENGYIDVENAGGLFRTISSFDYIKLNNLTVKGNFNYNNGILIGKSSSCTELKDFIISNCKIYINSYSLLDYTTSKINECNVNFENTFIDFTYSGLNTESGRVININPVIQSKILFNNFDININNLNYAYGYILLRNMNNVIINNVKAIAQSDKCLFAITSNNIDINNVYFNNGSLEFIAGGNCNINNVDTKSIKLANIDDKIVNTVINNFNGVLVQEPKSDNAINIKLSDIYVYKTNVLISNGFGDFNLEYPHRFYSIKILNTYVTNKMGSTVSVKSQTQYSTDFRIVTTSRFNGEVECVVLYSL